MARTNGGITGVANKTSFGKCKVTSFTSSGNLCTSAETRIVECLIIAGGGGCGVDPNNGAAAGGCCSGGLLDI